MYRALLKKGALVVMWDPALREKFWGHITRDVDKNHVYANVVEMQDHHESLWDLELVSRAVWSFVGPIACPVPVQEI